MHAFVDVPCFTVNPPSLVFLSWVESTVYILRCCSFYFQTKHQSCPFPMPHPLLVVAKQTQGWVYLHGNVKVNGSRKKKEVMKEFYWRLNGSRSKRKSWRVFTKTESAGSPQDFRKDFSIRVCVWGGGGEGGRYLHGIIKGKVFGGSSL